MRKQRETLPQPTSSGNRTGDHANLTDPGRRRRGPSATCKKARFHAQVDGWHAMNDLFCHALQCD
eukprot:4214122-Amphidinium_carterae.2